MALRQLRRNRSTSSLWVDAVCIDQGDLKERNHQVRMMRRIFSHASSVIVWLGETPSSATTVERLVLDYNRKIYKSVKGEVPSILKYHQNTLNGMNTLFSRPWWTRVWIIQEVVSAKEIVVHYGNRVFPWRFLRNIPIRGYPAQRVPLPHQCRDSSSLTRTKLLHSRSFPQPQVHDAHPPLAMHPQLQRHGPPRDKLYALLGMESDISPDDLTPDYNLTVEQVVRNLVRFLINTHHSLDIITSTRLALTRPGNPTWLPDWRTSDTVLPLHGEEVVASQLVRTSGNTRATASLLGPPGKENILKAEGIIIDSKCCQSQPS
ncbi:heterokaryon incompatibility protein-domain-containing protein [Podospora aff. communis PSN243]|uniref:Heterokaryon incompatibility protein-domain-containing protein n=1 Tax=Podospora aff. communis PSN243 TaxID=3040156 RepID=A0AAV9GA82_9PEZI|nr:heterokaryon incompatibility protein-domain-containing protein [Podospora aff. communis PSN243]